MSKNKRKLNVKLQSKPRNRFAIDPIMSKGGSHQKSTKAERKSDKQKLRKELFCFLSIWFTS